MTCVGPDCVAGCPPGIFALACLGGAIIYALIAWVISRLALYIMGKELSELNDNQQTIISLAAVFWPLLPAFLIIWLIGEWITLPITAARKSDLVVLEKKISKKIEEKCTNNDEVFEDMTPSEEDEILEFLGEAEPVKPKFKVGDRITGVKGNPDGYKHLYRGCVCRVLSIDDKGSMKLILLDHQDKEAHAKSIGRIFKAPARNFELIKPKKTAKKTTKKATKKKK